LLSSLPRFLHSYLSHQFSDSLSEKLVLHARARQFSSFVLMVGAIASIDLFIPKYAVVCQNKDDLKIPLMLNTIPSAKVSTCFGRRAMEWVHLQFFSLYFYLS
jgi:hypothetical protein